MRRIATAAVLIPLVTYVALWGHKYLFLLVLSTVAVLCFREFGAIASAHGVDPPGPMGYAVGLVVLLVPRADLLLVTALALAVFGAVSLLAQPARVLPRVGALLFGVIYVFGSWRAGSELRAISPYWLLFALALNWIGDSAAYYVGKTWGRHKLAPRLSPAKSWEGSIASATASLLFGFFFIEWLLPGVGIAERLAISAVGNVAGQIGDLAESALKRGAGLKDSGNLLPGHGGWLDRVDGTLFAMPAIYLLLALFGN